MAASFAKELILAGLKVLLQGHVLAIPQIPNGSEGLHRPLKQTSAFSYATKEEFRVAPQGHETVEWAGKFHSYYLAFTSINTIH